MTEQEFRAQLLREGFGEPVPVRRESGAWEEHSHPFAACGLILEGEMRIDCADGSRVYREGDVFRLGFEQPHAEYYGPQGVVYLAGRKTG